MFFLFSKILSFLIDPLFWVVILFFLSIILRTKLIKKRFFILGFIILLIFSNAFIYNLVNDLWLVKFEKTKKNHDYGIILGGMIDLESEHDNIIFLNNNDRLLNTIELFSKGFIKKILITGASGSLTSKMKEAEILKNYLIETGIPDSCILTENKSNNTYENAMFCEGTLNNIHPNSKLSCLIITSDFHMRRTMACFKKTKLNVYPFTKKSKFKHFDLEKIIIPQSKILFRWKILFHEIIGYMSYKIFGYL